MNKLSAKRLKKMQPSARFSVNLAKLVAQIDSAAVEDVQDIYLVACAKVQIFSDLLAADIQGCMFDECVELKLQKCLELAARKADLAAKMMLGSEPAEYDSDACPSGIDIICTCVSALNVLTKVLRVPMPECCGYDLANLAQIVDDVERLTATVSLDHSFLIVGVLTGGAYIAPLWKAALVNLGATDVHWCMVRPSSGLASVAGLDSARELLKQKRSPLIVIVDDRPDTGGTVSLVAEKINMPNIELWFSSVGNLRRLSPLNLNYLSVSVCIKKHTHRRRLWQSLLPSEHDQFFDRLRNADGITLIPEQAQLLLRCPQGELSYGSGCAWLPWNDCRVQTGRRPLVNPRKTPLEIVLPEGSKLLHLRFIGEYAFGRAEFSRIQRQCPTREAWLVDGYVITADIGISKSFISLYETEVEKVRDDLLQQAARWLVLPLSNCTGYAHNGRLILSLGARWVSVARKIRERLGIDIKKILPKAIQIFLVRPVPWPGAQGGLFPSSIRYSSGSWHWQVDLSGRLHRFQLEANWGDISFLELEVSVFILENHLAIDDSQKLTILCGLEWSSVLDSLPLAILIIIESRVSSVRLPSDNGCLLFKRDLLRLMMTAVELAELNVHGWI